ncbi:3-hydroxyacyl-CoA dehydrogenase [Lujinxingia litoralis]|uniref:3-hydroxyacyl-CoA dehydrogenase n=1 Tax=Lujinxingia litoralis TaxID=2211119 RepID=A0A328C6D8_9DELT|nr:SDR family oxidoreductase [Lujinxingia litoralis]RAL20074.1 3-hydroxyacyl-CoA dehydrogenase [Lujinxingia litoralis]
MTQTVVITGGSSGIGLESARQFVRQGHRVVLCARDPEKLASARAQLHAEATEAGARVETHVLDVVDQQAVETLFERLGPIDVLVANAGICRQARLDDPHSDQVWKTTFDINVHGAYHCIKAAAKTMPEGARIVTVSSNLGKNARAGYEAYTASKHAVLGLTKSVALELASRQIRVNAVCPGWVNTPMAMADSAYTAEQQGQAPDEFRRRAIAQIPLGRMVEPGEVAALIAFLASDAASAITGQSYNVSNGEFFN